MSHFECHIVFVKYKPYLQKFWSCHMAAPATPILQREMGEPTEGGRDGEGLDGWREGEWEERERSTGSWRASTLHFYRLSRSSVPDSHPLFPQFLLSRELEHRDGLTLRLHLTAGGHGQEER